MRVSIRKVVFVLLVFIYVYVPPVLPISTGIIMSWFFGIYFICNLFRIQKNLRMREILIVVLAFLTMLMWALASYINEYDGIKNIVPFLINYIYILSYSVLGAIVICDLSVKLQIAERKIWMYVICAGVIQGVLGIMAFIIRPFQSILCYLLENIMTKETIILWRNYRLYGLSCGLTFGMPIAQVLIGGMTILYAKKYDSKFYVFLPILWGSAIINARVSLIIVAIVLACLAGAIIRKKPNFKVKRFTLIFFLTFIIVAVLGMLIIIRKGIDLGRIMDPVLEIASLLQGEIVFKTEGYLAYLFLDPKAFVIPKGKALWTGGGVWNNVSDIGYIHNLWIGGILYSIAIYTIYIVILKRMHKKLKKEQKYLSAIVIILGTSLFVANFKGDIFGSMNEVQNLFFLLAGTILFIKGKEEKNNIE